MAQPSTQEIFQRYATLGEDGTRLLPRPLIPTAALQAGYQLNTPIIDDYLASNTNTTATTSSHPGHVTAEEFDRLCAEHPGSLITAEGLADAIVIVAPSNVLTRASLEEIVARSGLTGPAALTEEEIDAMFAVLDTAHKGAITGDDVMRAFHGDAGAAILQEARRRAVAEAVARKEREEQARAEEEEERRRQAELKAQAEAEAAAKAKAAQEAAKAQEELLARQRAEQEAAKAKAAQEAAAAQQRQQQEAAAAAAKKKKASACC